MAGSGTADANPFITGIGSSTSLRSFSVQQLRQPGSSDCSSPCGGRRQRPQEFSSTTSSEPSRKRSRSTNPVVLRYSGRSSSGLPSPPSSDDEYFNVYGDVENHRDGSSSLPTPPSSDDEALDESSNGTAQILSPQARPFPLEPAVLPLDGENRAPRSPNRRVVSPYQQQSPASPLPDRFISNRSTPATPQRPDETFRVSKAPEQLLPAERLQRDYSASPNPFGPLPVSRTRDGRLNSYTQRSSTVVTRLPSRTVGTTNASELPLDPSMAQNRQVSPGAVWNVGGTVQANLTGPVRGISNGRGGFTRSGSNAPMYDSQFLDDLSIDQDVDQMERRLAAALDIDQTSKVLNISRSPENSGVKSIGSLGMIRRRLYLGPRQQWKDSAWTQNSLSSSESCAPRPPWPAIGMVLGVCFCECRYDLLTCPQQLPRNLQNESQMRYPSLLSDKLTLNNMALDDKLTIYHSIGCARSSRRLLLHCPCILLHNPNPCRWACKPRVPLVRSLRRPLPARRCGQLYWDLCDIRVILFNRGRPQHPRDRA